MQFPLTLRFVRERIETGERFFQRNLDFVREKIRRFGGLEEIAERFEGSIQEIHS
jgi:hypothetical protein